MLIAAVNNTASAAALVNDGATADGAAVMTAQLIRAQCKAHGGYGTEELNEKLFLHRFGFGTLANLGLYTGCRVLYISHNALKDLRPLAHMASLVALYASNNALASCTMLPVLPALETLDVSHNCLADLKGVAAAAPALETLLASHNRVETMDGARLCAMPALTTIDLAHNKLADEEKLLSALSNAPTRGALLTLIVDANEAQRRAGHYRKRWIGHFPALRALDALPVFPEERERAEAFCKGGLEAEAAAASAACRRQDAEQAAQFRYYGEFRAEPRGRRMMEGPRSGATSYFRDHADGGGCEEDDNANDVYIPAASM